jgi:hypothetical protein
MSLVLVAEGDDEASRSERFERWALSQGVAGCARAVGSAQARLFVRGDLTLPAPAGLPNPYLTIYEHTGPVRPDVVVGLVGGRPVESSSPPQHRAMAFTPTFTFGDWSDLAAVAGILVVLVDNSAHDRETEFNAWYNDIHLSDVARAGGFRSATRYESVGVSPHEPRYLTIYQTDRDPTEARRGVLAKVGDMQLWPAMQQFHTGDYIPLG